MNTQQIRKLPGAKKEFPFVKAKIDNRKPVKLANKPAVRNPDEKIHLVPAQSAKADVAPLVTKVGFGYQGFASTSITAAIPKHEIVRPLADHRDKKIHPRDWNSSLKPELSSVKEKAVVELKSKPFKARPVPRSHYDAPLPPVSKKVKVKTTATAEKVKKTPEPTARPGLVSRVWHSVVDPILHPVNGETAGKVITSEPDKKDVAAAEVSPVVVHPQPEPTADPAVQVQPTAEINTDAASAHPGLASRMWHSVVDPILHPKKPEPDDEKSVAGHEVDEKPDEMQPDVQEGVEVVEAILKTDLEGETTSPTPEAVEDQPIAEAVEVTSVPQEVESRLKTEATGTRKSKRRHDKRRRHSDGHLTKKEPEMPEEPVRPGLLRRAVVGIGSTAWSAGKSVLSGVGSVVGLGRTKTPDSIPDEPAAVKDQKKHRHHKKKTHHKRSAGKDQ
jgi:hypothetical protein